MRMRTPQGQNAAKRWPCRRELICPRDSAFLARNRRHLAPLAAAQNRQRDRRPDAVLAEVTMKLVDAADDLVGARDDHIPVTQPGRRRRTAGLDRRDEYAGRHRDLIDARNRARSRHVLTGDAEIAAADLPIADESRGDEPCGVARN